MHLDRLEDSARYFTFPCDRAEVKAALLAHAAKLIDCHPERVRRGGQIEGPASSISAERVGNHESLSSSPSYKVRLPGAPSFPQPLAERVGNHETQSPGPFYKVRLLLDRQGNLHIEDEILQENSTTASARPIRVRIASQRTNPRTPCSSTRPLTGPSMLKP